MLYVSRFLSEDIVGVVDTDDNVEEYRSVHELIRIVIDGVSIEGLSIEDNAFGIADSASIVPWSGLRLKTVLATKLYSVYGIDIRVYQDGISGILWQPVKLTAPVTIRLSDFASKLYPGFLNWTAVMGKRPQLFTVILDDNIQVPPDAFKFLNGWDNEIGGVNLCVDVRELHEAAFVYEDLAEYVFTHRGRNRIKILDNPERFERRRNNARARWGYK